MLESKPMKPVYFCVVFTIFAALLYGQNPAAQKIYETERAFEKAVADKGINAVYYDAADRLVASGYLWAENRKQLAFKPLVVSGTSGRGIVVGFTQDPTFRGIEDGMNMLLLNAIFRGPAHAR